MDSKEDPVNSISAVCFQDALPRLANAYMKGKLVPFLGLGISAPTMPNWKLLLQRLSVAANVSFPDKTYSSQELIELSEHLVSVFMKRGEADFSNAIGTSLGYKTDTDFITPTPQCENLSKIWWPLVLTTNYDRMFVDAYEGFHGDENGISVFGRSQIDCHSLLSNLNAPSNTAYWALQGYLGKSENGVDLKDEIVLGYRQYRSATFGNSTFRSVFAEVFRNYSLFFIGSGLSEEYFRSLFGEVLERLGRNPTMHYALFRKEDLKSVDSNFLRTKLNILPVYYDHTPLKYDKLDETIKLFEAELGEENYKLYSFGFDVINFQKIKPDELSGRIEIVASKLTRPRSKECCVCSAGSGLRGEVWLSGAGRDIVESAGAPYDGNKFVRISLISKQGVWRYGEKSIYAAVARNDFGATSHDRRDLRTVADTMTEVLHTLNGTYRVINFMLLAAGGKRTFPPIYSLFQMIRGIKIFAKESRLKSKVRIHVVDPSVLRFLRKNAMEIEELLVCDDIRFTVEIQNYNETERFTQFAKGDQTIATISKEYFLDSKYWNVGLIPAPFKEQQLSTDSSESLEESGVIPGSTLRYTRKGSPSSGA